MSAQFVLEDRYADPRHPKYFAGMDAIGPRATRELAQAMRFSSAQEAKMHPAYAHWSSFYEPVAVPASVDTRPEGGDATEIAAPFTGGAVPSEAQADAQIPPRDQSHEQSE